MPLRFSFFEASQSLWEEGTLLAFHENIGAPNAVKTRGVRLGETEMTSDEIADHFIHKHMLYTVAAGIWGQSPQCRSISFAHLLASMKCLSIGLSWATSPFCQEVVVKPGGETVTAAPSIA